MITAHDTFEYFGKAYDFEVRGIQGISTEMAMISQIPKSDKERLAALDAPPPLEIHDMTVAYDRKPVLWDDRSPRKADCPIIGYPIDPRLFRSAVDNSDTTNRDSPGALDNALFLVDASTNILYFHGAVIR